MSEGTIAAGDFTLGTPVAVGSKSGFGSFQGFFDISTMIASIDASDSVLFVARKQMQSGGGVKTFASARITGANLQNAITQGNPVDPLIFLPPVVAAAGYPLQLEVTWEAGTPKDIGWEHISLVDGS